MGSGLEALGVGALCWHRCYSGNRLLVMVMADCVYDLQYMALVEVITIIKGPAGSRALSYAVARGGSLIVDKADLVPLSPLEQLALDPDNLAGAQPTAGNCC